jgi:lysylphosphatidylglycerol synthetase-like protein (DUF2156 family)
MLKKALAVDLNYPQTGLPAGGGGDAPVANVFVNLMSWLLIILGSLAIISFVIAGIIYLTATGYQDKMDQAKRAMLYSLIGTIVALLGFVIVKAIDAWLRGSMNF